MKRNKVDLRDPDNVIRRCARKNTIAGMDTNADVGVREREKEEPFLGQWGVKKKHEKGISLGVMINVHQIKITITFFQHNHNAMWVHLNSKGKHLLSIIT